MEFVVVTQIAGSSWGFVNLVPSFIFIGFTETCWRIGPVWFLVCFRAPASLKAIGLIRT